MRIAKLILTWYLLVLLCLSIAATGWTYELNGAGNALLSFQRSLAGVSEPGSDIPSPGVSTERGIAADDLIRGNGTRAGYVLAHGSIIPNSESVRVDGTLKSRNRDYYLDNTSGSIMFAEPVRASQSIRATYRYVKQEGQQSAISSPTLALRLSQSTSMGITYAYNAAASNSTKDLLTYGVNLTTGLGQKSTMTNMMYISTPRDSGRVSLRVDEPSKKDVSKPKADNVIVHNSNLQTGKLNVKLNYQDVGKDFAGFSVLKQQATASEAVLNQLEKEKGLTRLGFQADYDLGNKASTAIGMNRIGDDGGDIVKQSFKISTPKLRLNADFVDIDKNFSRFKDIAEGERDQWAKERGIKRSNIQLGLAPTKGMSADSAWNMLDMNTISDGNGSIDYRALNYAGKGFSIYAGDSSVDSVFKRITDLSDAERTQMALRIKQQFDPGATASSVTDKDKQSLVQESGLDRQNLRGNFTLGKTSAMLQFMNVGDATGEASRRGLAFEGKNFKVTGFMQDIDKEFKRELSPTEQLNFGKEYGMQRMNLTGDFTLNSGLKLGTYMSRVNDDNAGLVKYGLSFKGSKFSIAGNFQDIDSNFDRVMDLADTDREKMVAEKGMRRYDLTTHLQASKSITIDSFFYDARHSSEDIFKRQMTNNIVYSLSKVTRLSFLRDSISSGKQDTLSEFLRQKITLEHDFSFITLNAFQDTITKENSSDGTMLTEKTRVLRFDTDPKKRSALIGDWKRIDASDGKFTDTQVMKLNTKLNKNMSFITSRILVQTEQNEVATEEYGITGKIFGSLSLGGKFGQTAENGRNIGNIRELSLTPGGPKDLGIFKQLNWNIRLAEIEKSGKVTSQANAVKLESMVLKHKVVAEYVSSVKDEKLMPSARSISIMGNQDSKAPLRYNLSYKAYDVAGAETRLIRRFNADWQLSSMTKLAYNYFSYNEKPDGNIEPIGLEQFKLNTMITKTLGLVGQYEINDNYATDVTRTILSLGISGKLSKLSALEASYGWDKEITSTGSSRAHTYRLKYDYQLNADHFLTLNGTYVDRSNSQPGNATADDLMFQLDVRSVFN